MNRDASRHKLLATRRHLLGSMGGGHRARSPWAACSATGIAAADRGSGGGHANVAADDPLAARLPPLPAKAKRMIVIHLTGSPPNLDLYDHKPELVKHDGEDCPDEYLAGKTFAFTSGTPKLLGTPPQLDAVWRERHRAFRRDPNLHRVADKLCFDQSMHTDQFNHAPAELLVYTGAPRAGRPSLGSWVTYGLGTRKRRTCPASWC